MATKSEYESVLNQLEEERANRKSLEHEAGKLQAQIDNLTDAKGKMQVEIGNLRRSFNEMQRLNTELIRTVVRQANGINTLSLLSNSAINQELKDPGT